MASRKIKPDETARLSRLGDLTSREGGHVIALDGIAVIVNSSNAVKELSRAAAFTVRR